MTRVIDFKTSVAISLSGLDVTAKKLQELCGREKPAGQHHMRYMPSDIRAARYRAAGVEPPTTGQLPLVSKLPPVIVTRMTKGGVGKTSISVNVAAAMAMMGYRVLVIDADPQASASNLLGIDTAVYDTDILHIGHFLKKATSAPDADLPGAIKHIYEGGFLDLIPSDITLAETDASLVAVMSSHTRAELFLNRNSTFFAQHYDVLLSTPPPELPPLVLRSRMQPRIQARFSPWLSQRAAVCAPLTPLPPTWLKSRPSPGRTSRWKSWSTSTTRA